jgi:KDO2-lipid IV(A) lauroyltransferase
MYYYLLYKIGQFIALSLPLRLGYRVAVFCSDLHYLFANVDRRNVTANLKAIFPEKSEKEIAAIRLQMFRNFAKYLVDFFRFSKLDTDFIKENIRVENIDYVDQGLAQGKGVIALTAHIGNWELGGVVTALLGYPFWAVALPHKHKKVNDFFNSQRGSKGMQVIPFGRAARQCLETLQKNMVLALAGDRDFSEKGLVLDFFGRPTFLPAGAAAFSLKTGCQIVPGFMIRDEDDKFTLKFDKPIEYAPTKDRERDLVEITGRCKTVIENYIKRYPDQWYMFRKFWINPSEEGVRDII